MNSKMDFSKGVVDYAYPSLFNRYKIRVKKFIRLYLDSNFGLLGLYIVLFFIAMAVFAPSLAPYDPSKSDLEARYGDPSLLHPLGTDRVGRDILSQIIYGAQASVAIGLSAALISVIVGSLVGLLSGYYGGWIDTVLMRTTDFFIQIPVFPLMLIVVSLIGGGMMNLILVIGLLGWTGTARMVRSETLSLKERAFIESTRSIGATNRYIIFSHILPNVFPLVFANMILSIVDAIISEAGLSFLGFGITDSWSWGRVLHEAQKELAILKGAWWYWFTPGLCIMLIALGFALISFGLNEILNPQLRRR
ncbi:MAG: ABC transporter permease [Candidatus Hodarchaeales archaeon]